MSIYVTGGAEHEDEIELLRRDCEKVGEEASNLILENERLREQLKHQCELNDAAAEHADALRRELAEARVLLAEAREPLADIYYCEKQDCIACRIDAFLAADQPDDDAHCAECGAELELVRPGKWQHYGGVECTRTDKSTDD